MGFNSSKVTEDEIKSAYRKLAKKYHPDRNPGDFVAAEKFKDINEAYQVLANEEARRKYNRVHFAYSLKDGLDFSKLKERVDKTGASEFVEMFVGKQEIKAKKKSPNQVMQGENVEIQIPITLEEAFHGSNKTISFKSFDDKTKNITVKIPSGIINGGKIRIKGQGRAGKNGGAVGDLFLKINIQETSGLKLEGENLLLDLPLTPSEAALGSSIQLNVLDANVLLEVPEGTESGDILRVSGAGYFDGNGNRGDLLVKTKIMIPKELSQKERELYQELQNITNFKPRNS